MHLSAACFPIRNTCVHDLSLGRCRRKQDFIICCFRQTALTKGLQPWLRKAERSFMIWSRLFLPLNYFDTTKPAFTMSVQLKRVPPNRGSLEANFQLKNRRAYSKMITGRRRIVILAAPRENLFSGGKRIGLNPIRDLPKFIFARGIIFQPAKDAGLVQCKIKEKM